MKDKIINIVDNLGERVINTANNILTNTKRAVSTKLSNNKIKKLERRIEEKERILGISFYESEVNKTIENQNISTIIKSISECKNQNKDLNIKLNIQEFRFSCPSCGYAVDEGTKYCPQCGMNIEGKLIDFQNETRLNTQNLNMLKNEINTLNEQLNNYYLELGKSVYDERIHMSYTNPMFNDITSMKDEITKINSTIEHNVSLKCPKCNEEIKTNTFFCPNCGNNVSEISTKYSTNNNLFEQKRKVGIIASIIMICLILGIGEVLFGGRSYNAAVRKTVDAFYTGNTEKFMDVFDPQCIEYAYKAAIYNDEVSTYNEAKEKVYYVIEEQMLNKLFKLNDKYGKNWTYTFSVVEEEDVNIEGLEKSTYYSKNLLSKVEYSQIKDVEIELRIIIDGNTVDTQNLYYKFGKRGRNWYLISSHMNF